MTTTRQIAPGRMTSFDPGSSVPPAHDSEQLMGIEAAHGAHNYHPLPIVIHAYIRPHGSLYAHVYVPSVPAHGLYTFMCGCVHNCDVGCGVYSAFGSYCHTQCHIPCVVCPVVSASACIYAYGGV